MEHENAIETGAAERYILGEMDDTEATAFEKHFFECRICAQDVSDTATFADNARAALRRESDGAAVSDEPRVRERPWYFRPLVVLPYAATLVLGVALSYQALGPGRRAAPAPRVFEPVFLRVVRAAPPVVPISAGQDTFNLVIDINAPEIFPAYTLTFRSGEGAEVTMLETGHPDSGTLQIELPSEMFPDGGYTMILRGFASEGGEGEAVEEYRFKVSRPEPGG